MTEYILTSKTMDKSFAKDCLEALIGKSAKGYASSELALASIFLEGKLIKVDYQRAQKFYQLALEREKNLTKREVIKQTFLSLHDQQFQTNFVKFILLAYQAHLHN